MVLKSTQGKITRVGGSNGCIIYVPSKIIADSLFPLKVPCKVTVRIDGSHLVIEANEVTN